MTTGEHVVEQDKRIAKLERDLKSSEYGAGILRGLLKDDSPYPDPDEDMSDECFDDAL